MALRKIINPVEYSFVQWVNNIHVTGHWADIQRFYEFVKTVCRYNATRWKKREYLKERILQVVDVDLEFLDKTLDLYKQLIDFYQTQPITGSFESFDGVVKPHHYRGLQVVNNEVVEKDVPLRR